MKNDYNLFELLFLGSIANMKKSYRQRVSVVVVHKNRILGFHAEDPYSKKKYFFIPGGLQEDGETAERTAIRETQEETGYKIEIIPNLKIERRYDFEWNGQINDCATTFLVGRLIDEAAEEVHDADYYRGVAWIPISEINNVFAYHKDILGPILELIETLRM